MSTLITPLPMKSLPVSAQGSSFAGRIGASLWKWMEEAGRSRARRELMALASVYETNQPELAKELRAACARAC